MIVYRIEHRNDPLLGGFRTEEIRAAWQRLPTPYQDPGIGRPIREHEVCAATADKFEKWWPADPYLLDQMLKQGYHAIALAVPEDAACVGEHQVVFDRHSPDVKIVGELRADPERGWVH